MIQLPNEEWVYDNPNGYDQWTSRYIEAGDEQRKKMRTPTPLELDHWRKCRDEDGALRPPGWIFVCNKVKLCMVTVDGTVCFCSVGDVDPTKKVGRNQNQYSHGGVSRPPLGTQSSGGGNGEIHVLESIGGKLYMCSELSLCEYSLLMFYIFNITTAPRRCAVHRRK